MVVLVALLSVVVFIVIDLFIRMAMKRAAQARLRKERQAALDVALRIEVADEARTLKRVEVSNPKARILAVDDETIVLDSFRKILVLEGYSVDTVESGQEALALVQKNEYDFVFTDLKMPGFDGIEVTRAVKHIRPDIDVIMITGYATVQSAVDVMKYGALDYVEKPFTEDELTASVNKWLLRRLDKAEKQRPPKVHLITATSPGTESDRVYNVPAGVFISPAHVWARIEVTGEVRTGIDDFARKMVGEIDAVSLPRIGRRVLKGEPLFTVKRGGRSLYLPAPISGEIAAVNEALEAHPEYLKVNPYEIGWVCCLHPEDLAGDLESLRIGAGALAWYEEEIDRYRKITQETVVPAKPAEPGQSEAASPEAAEGAEMSDQLWEALARSFLLERKP